MNYFYAKTIRFAKWLGLDIIEHQLGKVNIISGHKGSGKTSTIEGLEYSLTGRLAGNERRTELIKHGEKEATLFVELEDQITKEDLIIDRKVRAESSDYLKVTRPGKAVPQTEGFLRSLIKGEIFRPGEFLKKTPEQQSAIILGMLETPWTMDNIKEWFGGIPEVNYDMHILKILKQIEDKYYKERTAVNQQIEVLEAQAEGYRKQLPTRYDGEAWRAKKVQEYYNAVATAVEVNNKITAAKNAIDGLESRIESLKSGAETLKQIKRNAFDRTRADSREYIQFLDQKVVTLNATIKDSQKRINDRNTEIDIDLERRFNDLKIKAQTAKDEARKLIDVETEGFKVEVNKHLNSITAKETELLNIDSLEEQALKSVDEKTVEQIKTVEAETGNSKKILTDAEPVDTDPLKKVADEVAQMQSYLREYDLMKFILIEKLAPKQALTTQLTSKIEKARSLPLDLLKISKCPVEGITVDSMGMLRINGTLLDGLSEGEKMEDVAVEIAKALADKADVKFICFDGFQNINAAEQKKMIREAKTDGYQWFFLITDDGELTIKIIDDVDWEPGEQVSMLDGGLN